MSIGAFARQVPYFKNVSTEGSGFILGDERGPKTCTLETKYDTEKKEIILSLVANDRPELSFRSSIEAVDAKNQARLPLKEGKVILHSDKSSDAFYNAKGELHIMQRLASGSRVHLVLNVTPELFPTGEVKAAELSESELFGQHIEKELRCTFAHENMQINFQFPAN